MQYGIFLIVILNIFAFVVMGIDKMKAKMGAWRIPEKILLGLAYLGGGLGALLAGQIFHHKIRKWYFWLAWVVGIMVCTLEIIFILK